MYHEIQINVNHVLGMSYFKNLYLTQMDDSSVENKQNATEKYIIKRIEIRPINGHFIEC